MKDKVRVGKKASKGSEQHKRALSERGPKRPPRQPTRADRIDGVRVSFSPEIEARIRSYIIYEDAHLMAFNKPSGLSSQGGRGSELNIDDMLAVFARSNGKRPRLIHRLDRDTSGLLLAAKSQPDAAFFGKAMIARDIQKTYLCLVSPSEKLADKGVIDVYLRREDIAREAYCRVCSPDHPDAQEAFTAYEVIARSDEAYLIKAMPKTGRMHQLRVHFAHMGAPILGDVRYGGSLRLGSGAVGRLMLHALSLDFPHPKEGRLRLDCPLADDFTKLLDRLLIDL